MRRSTCERLALTTWLLAIALSGCWQDSPAPVTAPPTDSAATTQHANPPAGALRDEIPPEALQATLAAHLEGVAAMERFEYPKAAKAFRTVHERAPGWIPGSINLAIALLNQAGEQDKNQTGKGNFGQAIDLLDAVIARDANNLYAHYCRGVILENGGEIARAHEDFRLVTERDPNDAHAWLKLGSTLTDPSDPARPAGPKEAKQLIEIYTKAFELNPYLVSALYKLQQAYGWGGERGKQKTVLDLWNQLNPEKNIAGQGETSEASYGKMGRYASIIDPIPAKKAAVESIVSPRFATPVPIKVSLPDGHHWATSSDFTGPLEIIGRARSRFGVPVAWFDADGDDRLDLFLPASVVGPKGVRDALLVNRGEGSFIDASREFDLPEDRASLGAAAGDFDADRKVDLFVTGVRHNRLYRNLGKRFQDVTRTAGLEGPDALSLTARWLDLDQDGDLDLYVVCYAAGDDAKSAFAGKPVQGTPNRAYRNDGKPETIGDQPPDTWAPLAVATEDVQAKAGLSLAFTPWPDSEALACGSSSHTAVVALDIDDDRDLDLVVCADGESPTAVVNDRLGRFHSVPLKDVELSERPSGLLIIDLDKDGKSDLVALSDTGSVTAWRNLSGEKGGVHSIAWDRWPIDARLWRTAVNCDLDLDTWPDLLGLGSETPPALAWARNEGRRMNTSLVSLGPLESSQAKAAGFAFADLVGDALPDILLIAEGGAPVLARNLGNGHHWLALDLSGRWHVRHDWARSNPHGIGARIALEGQGLDVPYELTTTDAGLAQSLGPTVLGLGKSPIATLLHVRWPDGVMQCELNVAADEMCALAEKNRKTGSCPVLFTWNGERFVCIGDFLGGGGLGYLVAPGVYSPPDRDESVDIAPDQLRAKADRLRIAVVEPMDEIAYLDSLVLDVVDRPAGIAPFLDERFVPDGPRPSGKLIASRTSIAPARATDLDGNDVTDRLRAWDRKTVDGFKRLRAWIGYAEEHGIVLDFGDRLSRFGPKDPLILCLAGWVEYPYSQTNYAAATAGVALRPPVLERRRDDGSWQVIEPHAGYPAGMPRMTALDLTGKLNGPRCILRLRTNMECYWDQAFVAVSEDARALRVTSLPVARAALGARGYLREVSPDGRLPLLYEYEHVDPAPLARMSGRLTRFGDVAPLLQADDDQLCLVGPGDEVRLEFDAASAPALPEGWTRSYVLRAIGYCKDADPFTAASDTVGPLPWRGMPDYPFGPEGERPRDASYERYLREYQTRPAGGA